ncbi:histidine kinase [Chryseobacterium sp. L7]|uniref:Histidine kinase n=1 Tax=Chryseobacterium endalhagicum TaxID=2797638 RepID=A0ABS1QEF3_9FLAO|nr:histidine kinase [Chryseobacterium endalhagicum]MBL1220697.1 histidine kinase [Chryseobacterium endalhagicum]
MKKLFILFSFFFWLAPTLFFAQIPGMVNYNEEDGLNNSHSYSLSQDPSGFLWIGSDNGLFRFDGKEFKHFNNKHGLKNIEALSCIPLSNGEVFVATFLNDFAYLKNGKVINSDMNSELKKIQFTHNPDYYIDGSSLYLYSTYNPANIYIYKEGKVNRIPVDVKTNSKNEYYTFGLDIPDHTFYQLDQYKGGNIIAYDIRSKKKTVCNIYANRSTFILRKGNIFVFRNKRNVDVYQLHNKFYFKKIKSYQAQENIERHIIDKNNRLWLCLEEGGALYFKQSLLEEGELTAPVKMMENYIMSDILVDKDNNTWFSTRNNGLFFIADRFFKNYIHRPISNNASYITVIAKNIDGHDPNIYLGYNESKSGLYHNGQVTDLVFEKNIKLEHKAIFAEGNTVLFGLTRRLFQYNTGIKETLFLKDIVLKNIVPYTQGSILLCTSDGLLSYNYRTRKYTDVLSKERIYTALPYAGDSLFAGGFKDLYKVNTITKKKTLFLEGYYFTDIKKLRDNLYVGATNLNGIMLFDNRRIIRKITESTGLSTGQIKKIEVENKNIFWASTNYGLSRIELKGNDVKINNFTQTDGLPSNTVAGCVLSGDTLFVGTSKGLGILSVKNLMSQKSFIDKKVIINSVMIGGKEIFDPHQTLSGQTPENDITFNVSFPDFTSQGKISYRYKIEGLSNDWQTSTSQKITLYSLPPGNYTFTIFGIGYNGKRSSVPTELHFEIHPKFWQTWWFKTMIISLGAAALFIMINLYFQKKRNKKLETLYYEKKIAELELQAIKAQINPHFIYNCLNSIQFLLYKKDYRETENYLEVFAQMIRKTLHYSEKTFMPIQEEADYLSLYLNMEKLRLKDLFDYKITISEKVDKNWVVPSLLIQPFVENAIKHGVSGLKDRKGKIDVSFDHTGTALCVIIEDNGVGIGSGKQTKADSFGVKLSQKRIETFRQLFETHIQLEIIDLSEKEQRPGTQIKLYIKPYENQNTSMHH